MDNGLLDFFSAGKIFVTSNLPQYCKQAPFHSNEKHVMCLNQKSLQRHLHLFLSAYKFTLDTSVGRNVAAIWKI